MSDLSGSRWPRDDGAEPPPSLTRHVRGWLRGVLGHRHDTTVRGTIAALIREAPPPGDTQPLSPSERQIIARVLGLCERSVADAMVPRADIVAVDADTPLPDIVRRMVEQAHSRVPVYRETLDDIVGVVHLKDALLHVAGGTACSVTEIVREPPFVAQSMQVLDLLFKMRQTRQHMALVVDEFGGIDGLVTIEDLVEEIVGDIEDEHDVDEAPAMIESGGSLLADARVPIEEFEDRLAIRFSDEERDEVDTLGGLVVSLAGRVPARGERLIHPLGLEFEIVDADPRRIKRLSVRKVG